LAETQKSGDKEEHDSWEKRSHEKEQEYAYYRQDTAKDDGPSTRVFSFPVSKHWVTSKGVEMSLACKHSIFQVVNKRTDTRERVIARHNKAFRILS
jgi:hypothetical protein